MRDLSFHISWSGPYEPHWPRGAWSVYQITGDEIAARVERYKGSVIARHPWCGYIGLFETLPEVMVAIEAAQKKAA